MTEEWLNAMHKGELTGVLMIDLCKAFDLVDHSLLLRKLKNYRCSENALTWFTSYLSERTQRIDINGQISNHLENKCGVPQGSILGPLFFIVFMTCICTRIWSIYLFLLMMLQHTTVVNVLKLSHKNFKM